eukprot:TRINITY_DN2554_c0_g1_i12.p1 TRINITY_DN2554_c0_g1~~TRINITY_DN2554_c0_g1_i12.p1  ORF type:complete len:207 (-),score=22.81 TRINITY_DN2554_c0_g1_i12:82-675(-)
MSGVNMLDNFPNSNFIDLSSNFSVRVHYKKRVPLEYNAALLKPSTANPRMQMRRRDLLKPSKNSPGKLQCYDRDELYRRRCDTLAARKHSFRFRCRYTSKCSLAASNRRLSLGKLERANFVLKGLAKSLQAPRTAALSTRRSSYQNKIALLKPPENPKRGVNSECGSRESRVNDTVVRRSRLLVSGKRFDCTEIGLL